MAAAKSMALLELANKLRFRESGSMGDLNAAVGLFYKGIAGLPASSQNYGVALKYLADTLVARFQKGGQRYDLDEAISLHRQALGLFPSPHPLRSTSLTILANTLLTRFQQGGQRDDLDEAITLHRQAIELQLSPQFTSFNNLSNALWTRFTQGGQKSDLDDAIDLNRQALALRPSSHPNRSISLTNLANTLLTRFKHGGQNSDLDEAIDLNRQACELQPSSHPIRSAYLNNFANALSTRFKQGGQKSDLDEAISLNKQALELQPSPHPLRSTSLNNLANAFSTLFKQGGQKTDLDESIALNRQALELRPSPHPDRSASLNNLAIALLTRFKQGGQKSDLNDAIDLNRQALELFPSPHPLRSTSLKNLANALSIRFEQGGQRSDLDEAITLNRQSVELEPLPHPNRSTSLTILANSLWTRFRQGGRRDDLDEAITLHRQAIELQPSPHSLRSASLNNLSVALSTRFERGGQKSDLDETISLNRQALELFPSPNPYRSTSLNNLASALLIRFERREGQKCDLDEAISLNRQALELFPSINPDRSVSLINLANALSTLFDQGGQKCDLDEAIFLYRQALELRPSPHPLRSFSLASLGTALVHAHSSTGGNSDFLKEAMSLFSTAMHCLSQPPSQRLSVAKSWIRHAVYHKHISAIDAYEAALQALPQLAALSFDLQSRQEALSDGNDSLVRDASICAIQTGNLGKAIEFLEAGRCIFWSQSLSLRSPFEQLHGIKPKLACKLRDIATALELGSYRDISADISDNWKKLSLDQEASRLNRLGEEWEDSIDEVRKVKGFEDFLRPHRFSLLQKAASAYPVVVLVANDNGSHCLILTSTSIHHIDIPSLPTKSLQNLVRLVQAAASQMTVSRSSIETIMENLTTLQGETRAGKKGKDYKSQSSDDIFKYVLRILWNKVVKPVISFLKIDKSYSGELPVLQWCPTGAFTFLPIHAAGCYNIERSSECTSDYFIFSYVPTISLLLTHDPAPLTGKFKMMVVIQSKELPSTKTELKNIERHVASDALIKLGVLDVPAKIEAVASFLSDSSIIHFACHGKQDRFKSLDSGLRLDDGLLRVTRIMQEKISNGSLAFLCACETAMGDKNLPDEAMSLGASLLFSGFRRVIATMWDIRDEDGPIVADAFYEELFRGPDGKPALEPDITKSPRALHFAVQKLRSEKVSFRRWVPFIHMGK